MTNIPEDFVYHLLHQLTCAAKETGWGSLLKDADALRSYLSLEPPLENAEPPPEAPLAGEKTLDIPIAPAIKETVNKGPHVR